MGILYGYTVREIKAFLLVDAGLLGFLIVDADAAQYFYIIRARSVRILLRNPGIMYTDVLINTAILCSDHLYSTWD